ncbi:MAG: hypothetical protein H7A21_20075 [Spirochaetales bacterium]|nr:hypothetical protein [Leptospiraceae bacterium]MCP5483747.1 hypothetical protein [Spirochaetales bacterium]
MATVQFRGQTDPERRPEFVQIVLPAAYGLADTRFESFGHIRQTTE